MAGSNAGVSLCDKIEDLERLGLSRARFVKHGDAVARELLLRPSELRVVWGVEILGVPFGMVARHPHNFRSVMERGLDNIRIDPPTERLRTTAPTTSSSGYVLPAWYARPVVELSWSLSTKPRIP